MYWQFNPLALPGLTAAVISAILGFLGLRLRRTNSSIWFVILMAGIAWWATFDALDLLRTDLAGKILLAKLLYFGITTVPVAWLVLAIIFTGNDKWLSRRNIMLVMIMPLTTLAIVWTNDFHELFWQNMRLVTTEAYTQMAFEFGIMYLAWVAYSYTIMMVTTILLIVTVVRAAEVYRKQATIMLIASTIPWITNILYIIGLTPGWLQVTSMAFTLSGLVFSINVFRFRWLDIMPIARDRVIEGMDDAVIVLDALDRIVEINPAAQSALGWKRDEVVGQLAADLLSDHERKLIAPLAGVFEAQTELVALDRTFDLKMSPLYGRRQRRAGKLIVLRDITARKQVEAELTRHRTELETLVEERTAEVGERQDRYRALFEAANDAIFILSLEGVHIAANQAACQMLGYELDELISLSYRDIVVPDDIHKSEAVLPRLLAAEALPINERRFRRKNGETFPVEINVVLVTDRTGEPLHIQSIVRDISQRKMDEEALQDAYRQLMKLDDRKTTFIDSVSHELRTPIANLKLYHHLQIANPDKSPEYADILQTQTSRLEEIVEGILLMQRVQQGLTDFSAVTVNLDKLVSEVIQYYQQPDHTEIEIVYDQRAEDIRLLGDPALLRQALTMLLDNGVKYSASPGLVEVTMDNEPGVEPPQVMISIANVTCDLTPDDVPRLFERFFRGENALTLGVSGAGLGLSIAGQIVEQHQGQLTATFEPEQNNMFTVTTQLPIVSP